VYIYIYIYIYISSFKLQTEDGFIKAETCNCYVLLMNYVLYNKVILDYTAL